MQRTLQHHIDSLEEKIRECTALLAAPECSEVERECLEMQIANANLALHYFKRGIELESAAARDRAAGAAQRGTGGASGS